MLQQSETFNQYKFLTSLEESIKQEIDNGNIKDSVDVMCHIDQTIDNEVIYYSDCWDICNALRPNQWDDNDWQITSIDDLAAYALRELINSDFDANQFFTDEIL
jgi:hypothetical protein